MNVRRVTVRTWKDRVQVTFVMYGQADPSLLEAPRCGSLAVTFLDQHVTVETPDRTQARDPKSIVVVEPTSPSSKTFRMTLRRSALGSEFSRTEPWQAVAVGPACPPLNVNEQSLPAVHP